MHVLRSFGPAILLLLLGWPARAQDSGQGAMRCAGRILKVGDPALELRRLCKDPEHIAIYPQLSATGLVETNGRRHMRYEQHDVEVWTYRGSEGDLVRLVRVERGKITAIHPIGRNELGPSPGCQHAILRDRATTGEVHLACGAPHDQSRWFEDQVTSDLNGVELRRLVTKERWVYDPGPGALLRILEFENGRLVRIETGNRSRSP